MGGWSMSGKVDGVTAGQRGRLAGAVEELVPGESIGDPVWASRTRLSMPVAAARVSSVAKSSRRGPERPNAEIVTQAASLTLRTQRACASAVERLGQAHQRPSYPIRDDETVPGRSRLVSPKGS